MLSENTKNLYKHYLTVPAKARHAAELLKKFPELESPIEHEKVDEPKEEVKEVKKHGKKPKR